MILWSEILKAQEYHRMKKLKNQHKPVKITMNLIKKIKPKYVKEKE